MPEAPGVAVPADGGGHPGVPGEGLPVHHEDVAVLQPHPRHRPDKQYTVELSTVLRLTCSDVKLGRLPAKMRDGQQTVTLTALPFTDDAIDKVHFTPFWLVSCLKIEIVVYVG